jgi:hypothetical protein
VGEDGVGGATAADSVCSVEPTVEGVVCGESGRLAEVVGGDGVEDVVDDVVVVALGDVVDVVDDDAGDVVDGEVVVDDGDVVLVDVVPLGSVVVVTVMQCPSYAFGCAARNR